MARRKKARRSNGPKPGNGKKLGATLKKWGVFRGSGKWAKSQTGIASAEKVVPVALGLVALAALTPALGGQIAASLGGVPVAGPVANTLVGYGAKIRGRVGMR